MKALYPFYTALVFVAFSCATAPQPTVEDEPTTIETASGLTYTYVTKGTGKEVEMGSQVSAYLSLSVNDSVVWNTDGLPDSLFEFDAGNANLIKGFNEMVLLLREGDEVSVTMPAAIAYGEKGTPGFVPPNTPITYAPFRVVKVADPVPAPVQESMDSLEG